MHRDDKSKFLLYIEPKIEDKLKSPIEDDLTRLMETALSRAKEGTANYSDTVGEPKFRSGSGYKGTHSTACGQRSDSVDFLLENGMITNSLAPYYLRWYRYSIPENDMNKLKQLAKFYDK